MTHSDEEGRRRMRQRVEQRKAHWISIHTFPFALHIMLRAKERDGMERNFRGHFRTSAPARCHDDRMNQIMCLLGWVKLGKHRSSMLSILRYTHHLYFCKISVLICAFIFKCQDLGYETATLQISSSTCKQTSPFWLATLTWW